jgi:hypothetical protein
MKSEWISVEDRLPEVKGDYIIYDPKGLADRKITVQFYIEFHGWSGTREPTHWMPLMKPPQCT